MKVKFVCVFCLLSLVISAAAARPPSAQQLVKDALAEQLKDKKRPTATETLAAYRALRERLEFATNALVRLAIAEGAVDCCRVVGKHHISLWQKELQQELPGEVKPILDNPEYGPKEKLPFVRWYAEWLASERDDFNAAEKVVTDFIAANPGMNPGLKATAELILFDLYKWQDRFADAWTVLERVSASDPRKAAQASTDLAADTGDWAKSSALWAKEKAGGEAAELLRYATLRGSSRTDRPKDYLERAEAFVKNAANPIQSRLLLVVAFFCSDRSEKQRAFRASVKEADFTKITAWWTADDAILRAYQYADYELAAELLEFFRGMKSSRTLKGAVRDRLEVVSLGAIGRKDEAAKLAETRAADETLDALDRAKFRASAAILRGGDPSTAIAEAKLKPMDEAVVWRTCARQALIWGNSPLAERCSAEYSKHFADVPHRMQKVVWFDRPLVAIADWRKIAGQLEPQYCDIKFRMAMEDLVTDVATGRQAVEESALDSTDARMELTTTCDKYGFHIFLRTEDPNARAVENGFASGMATEMYFAPGENQPYVCFGTSPTEGVQYAFQTMYDNRDCSRLDALNKKGGRQLFHCETEFTDTDYVLHLFFAWENFYQKLPGNGTDWKYDCLTWTPKGAYNWAGSQGPHSCMAWGDLRFELTDAQITEIRRGLLCRTHKNWRKTGKLDIFEKWADEEIGDPGFAAAKLAPLEKDLADAMAGVDLKMSDAEVNRIFEAALVKCRGIKHEIDALRKQWLLEEFTK